jgi:hypothetical protein
MVALSDVTHEWSWEVGLLVAVGLVVWLDLRRGAAGRRVIRELGVLIALPALGLSLAIPLVVFVASI